MAESSRKSNGVGTGAPRLLLIVSDGPLMIGRPEKLAGRPAIHMPIAPPDLPLPAIATSLATGVDATVHGIVTAYSIESGTLEIRPTTSTDRRFPAIWTEGSQAGLQTALINWPAVEGDPDVATTISPSEIHALAEHAPSTGDSVSDTFQLDNENLQSDVLDALQRCAVAVLQAKNILHSGISHHIIGVALPNPMRFNSLPSITSHLQGEVESLLSLLAEETNVLLVHRRTDEQGNVHKSRFPLEATYLVRGFTHEVKRTSYIQAVGGASFGLANVTCPLGVFLPKFTFLPQQRDAPIPRSFPSHISQDSMDWESIVEDLIAIQDAQPELGKRGISLLITRFSTLSTISLRENRWDVLEKYSDHLIKLRGNSRDYWFYVLALHQQGKLEALNENVAILAKQYPNILVTKIAKCMVLIDTSQDEAKKLLEEIDPTEIKIASALGTFGRLAIRVKLIEKGIQALQLSITKSVELPADRAILAEVYFSKEEYELALKALGGVGVRNCELSWRLLRLRILVALQKQEDAKQLATSILADHPANPQAVQVLGH